MPEGLKLKGRYDLKETLGRGGMGVVYRAYDNVLKCDVAIKTLREAPAPAALQLFYRECETLVALNHPNIVQILDIGEVEEEGQRIPYFVMPLLPGMPLDKLIRSAEARLNMERRVEILTQVCRGLHAAHVRGLVHRDIKPGNVFVMPDYSAEIIDFGVAHMISSGTTGLKGTLLYMAPELIEGKAPSPLSDIFAVGVMAFELFTRRRPFERPTEREIVEAILHESPPPASDLDPSVNQAISRVIHKCMAKQPWHRFANAREFADCLGKAYRGEPIEYFDTARIQPRIQRARTAFEQGDHQFAADILAELEAEGHLDADLSLLHKQVEIAGRQQRIRQLLESARSRFVGEEYPLALQKVQEVLSLEPDNADALSLKSKIESARGEEQIEGWFRLARQHIENHAFTHAREALQNVLQIRPQDSRANSLISDVNRREQQYLRIRQEKEQLYQAAVEAFQKGDVSSALTKLERVLEIERKTPDTTHQDRGNSYQTLYNQVRSEHDAIQGAYSEARAHLAAQDFAKALAVCEKYLEKYPGHALFQSLKFDTQEQQRLQLSAHIAEIDRSVEAETDLDRKVHLIQEALERFPGESHFERLLRIMRERLDLVNGIVAKARYYEDRGQFAEALGQWEILKTIHARYPGLQFEIDRLSRRREQQARSENKARWVQQIDAHLAAGEFARALEVSLSALEEFPGDGELLPLAQMAQQSEERAAEARRLQAEGERLCDNQDFEEGLEALRRAHELDPHNDAIRTSLVNRLAARAQKLADTDWRAAEVLIERALDLDAAHTMARGVRLLLEDRRREEFLTQALARIRQLQAAGDAAGAWVELGRALEAYPQESRLLQLRPTLENNLRRSRRSQDLDQVRALAAEVALISALPQIRSLLDRMRAIAQPYAGDQEFQAVLDTVELRLRTLSEQRPRDAVVPAAPPATAPPEGADPAEPPLSPAAPLGATLILQQPAKEPASAAATPASHPEPERIAPRKRTPSKGQMLLWAGTAAVLVLAVVAGGVRALRRRPAPTPAAAAVSFQIRSVPPGARLEMDGKPVGTAGSFLSLPPGDYMLQVILDGYQSEIVSVALRNGGAAPAPQVSLKPLPQKIRVISNLQQGKLSLDGGEPVALAPDAAPFLLDMPTPGSHTVRLEGGGKQVLLSIRTQPAALPQIEKIEASKGVEAVVVSSLGHRAIRTVQLRACRRASRRPRSRYARSERHRNQGSGPRATGVAIGRGRAALDGIHGSGPGAFRHGLRQSHPGPRPNRPNRGVHSGPHRRQQRRAGSAGWRAKGRNSERDLAAQCRSGNPLHPGDPGWLP